MQHKARVKDFVPQHVIEDMFQGFCHLGLLNVKKLKGVL